MCSCLISEDLKRQLILMKRCCPTKRFIDKNIKGIVLIFEFNQEIMQIQSSLSKILM